jgi:hypothetical protein
MRFGMSIYGDANSAVLKISTFSGKKRYWVCGPDGISALTVKTL